MNKNFDVSNRKISSNNALCCCEYYNIHGERSHIMAMFCDCEIVDSICDRIIKRENISADKLALLHDTIEDRCRIPWFTGAVKINPANFAPVIFLPFTLFIASMGLIWTIVSFISLPIVLSLTNRLFSRERRSKMFFVLAIVSIIFSFLVFTSIVMSLHRLVIWEILLFFTLFCFCVKQIVNLIMLDPGNPSTIVINEAVKDLIVCKSCNKYHEKGRSGYCAICNQCIAIRDHHCVWIDKCIGEKNHKLFIWCLVACIITGSYGLLLTLTSVCAPILYFRWFLWPKDCSYVYMDYLFSLPFVTAIYASIFTVFLVIILIHQIILISQNLTMHEWNRARHNLLTKYSLFLNRRFNPYDVGIIKNWKLFWTQSRGNDISPMINI